ncbi:MAG: hypothetical protein AAF914_07480 [Pseudomonadota bacterium]
MSSPKLPDEGWRVFAAEPAVSRWIAHVRPTVEAVVRDPAHGVWLRHGGTWFAGVDVLPNDPDGRVSGGPPLDCAARRAGGRQPLHPGQVSVTWPGYPGRDAEESDAAHRFRRDRDAAHLDGLLPVGSARRRMLREPHAYILGLPVTPMGPGRAPLVVWEGSHEILRKALSAALAPHDPETWGDVDVTDAYQAARRACFERCRRVEISAVPGEAVLLHRLMLHGVAPWTGPDGPARTVIYFRPLMDNVESWLAAP